MTKDGRPKNNLASLSGRRERDQTGGLKALNRIALALAGDLNLETIVQTVTDAATELTGANFGAFFYNLIDEKGESYLLYSLAGAPRSAFEKFGMPRNTAVFDPTFRGLGVVRSADIRADPRYGKSGPHFGMPKGHLPVVSYLAVPVKSRSGEIHGGLFFGHEQADFFTEEDEEIIVGIAAHAAIALDNARLLQDAARHASIVQSSDDAIISKNLNGIITSWNRGAERLFGYSADEAIGRPVTMLIPQNRHHEEPTIIGRIVRGERIDHYETVRQRKDGTLLDVSLTVSPIKDQSGVVVGASNISRDISHRKRAEEQQAMLLREMNHRIKNLFTVAASVVSLSARSASTPQELASSARERLTALARAHELTLRRGADGTADVQQADLRSLIETILAPYRSENRHWSVEGPQLDCGPSAITAFALLLHEFATNSVKYGALSTPGGSVIVTWTADVDLLLNWTESGFVAPESASRTEGFGSVLVNGMVATLGGEIAREWKTDGLAIRLIIPLEKLTG
jgi:PAS domain S-box-containing protein